MKTKRVKLTGISPLLMHGDLIIEAEEIKEWRKNPENKKHCVAGDDRSPAWTWCSYIYQNGSTIGIPSDNLMTMLREGASKVPLVGGKSNETFKKVSQSGLLIIDPMWELFNKDGVSVDYEVIKPLIGEMDFRRHVKVATDNGFNLHVKRAKVGMAKHIRVRAIWSAGWSIEGDIVVNDSRITNRVFKDILEQAGMYCGLCDWRPSSPRSPGPHGMFSVEVIK
jgi:hypothetical protein